MLEDVIMLDPPVESTYTPPASSTEVNMKMTTEKKKKARPVPTQELLSAFANIAANLPTTNHTATATATAASEFPLTSPPPSIPTEKDHAKLIRDTANTLGSQVQSRMRNGAETTPEFYDLPEAPDYVSYHSWNKAFEDAPPHEAKAKAEESYKNGEYAQENNDAVRERSATFTFSIAAAGQAEQKAEAEGEEEYGGYKRYSTPQSSVLSAVPNLFASPCLSPVDSAIMCMAQDENVFPAHTHPSSSPPPVYVALALPMYAPKPIQHQNVVAVLEAFVLKEEQFGQDVFETDIFGLVSAAMSPYSAMLRDRRRKDVALDLAAQLAGEYGYWAGNGCGSLI